MRIYSLSLPSRTRLALLHPGPCELPGQGTSQKSLLTSAVLQPAPLPTHGEQVRVRCVPTLARAPGTQPSSAAQTGHLTRTSTPRRSRTAPQPPRRAKRSRLRLRRNAQRWSMMQSAVAHATGIMPAHQHTLLRASPASSRRHRRLASEVVAPLRRRLRPARQHPVAAARLRRQARLTEVARAASRRLAGSDVAADIV